MSLGEADAKFPSANEGRGIPPSPTRENPGQVFPKTDPHLAPRTPVVTSPPGAERYFGNPFLMNGALRKVDHAFGEVIAILESEEIAHSGADEESPLLQKFRRWREELDMLRSGFRSPARDLASPISRSRSREAGGMFVD